MSVWIEPKINWKATDYFNLDPDYNRIKGNIEYMKELSNKMYSDFPLIEMGAFTIQDMPFDTFLNNIVDNVSQLESNLYKPPDNAEMKRYKGGEVGWNADELNIIEGNILRLYNAIMGQWNCLQKMPCLMGVDEF